MAQLTRTPFSCCQRILQAVSRSICRTVSTTKNHYELLELAPNASHKEIKDAYFRLSKMYHPDVNPANPGAYTHFQKISEAYETLINASARRHYDMNTFGASYFVNGTPTAVHGPTIHTGKSETYDYDEWTRQHYGDEYDAKVREWRRTRHESTKSAEEQIIGKHNNDAERIRRQVTRGAIGTIIAAVSAFVFLLYIETKNYDEELALKMNHRSSNTNLKK